MGGRPECLTCRLGRIAGPGKCPLVRTPRKAGARVYREGAASEGAFFVIEGEVLLLRQSRDGVWPRALRGGGALLGLEALKGEPYRDDAVCTAETQLCTLSRTRLEAFLSEYPAAARAVAELALEEAMRTVRELEPGQSCQARLARFLLARQGGGKRVTLAKSLVAALLQMRPETLSRCAGRLARAGAIDASTLAVKDARKLAELAEAADKPSRRRRPRPDDEDQDDER